MARGIGDAFAGTRTSIDEQREDPGKQRTAEIMATHQVPRPESQAKH